MPITEDVSEREKWERNVQLREREIAIKEREVARREREGAKGRWANPLVLAIFAATLAAVGNATVAWINGRAERTLEDAKAEAERILEVIKTGDTDKAVTNLKFLLDAGLILDASTKLRLESYLSTVAPGKGPSLPATLSSANNPYFSVRTPAAEIDCLLEGQNKRRGVV